MCTSFFSVVAIILLLSKILNHARQEKHKVLFTLRAASQLLLRIHAQLASHASYAISVRSKAIDMAGLSIFTNVVEIVKICQSVAALIKDAKNAPIEYQNSVRSILSTEETFQCLKETIHEITAANIEGSMAILHRLESEVNMARSALKKAETVLFDRYATKANPRLWNTWKRRTNWRNTRDNSRSVYEMFATVRTALRHY